MRRNRIKGIANIPPRKKTDPPHISKEDLKNQPEISKLENDFGKDNCEADQLTVKSENIVANKKIINEITQKVRKLDTDKIEIDSPNSVVSVTNESVRVLKKGVISVLDNVLLKSASELEKSNSAQIQEESLVSLVKNDSKELERKPTTSRRRAIKPSISVHAISRKADPKISNESENGNKEQTKYEGATKIMVENCVNETRLSEQSDENVISEAETIVSQLHGSHSNNIVNSAELRKLKSPINVPLDIRNTSSNYATGSDCEYPPPPSPSKLNRSRIKAIPKIGNRKISFSASESEDECKKVDQRIRHDSQSSNLSGVHESVIEQPSIPKVMEFSSVIQRKCKRTEWSRKLAEARREFTRKFMTGKPDHKKLTMIDLIFYNPTTNAMKNERSTISEADPKSDSQKEEEVDNPSGVEDDPSDKVEEASKKSDEENEIPAPQIRIGPSGEIILDEKSLVIENKQTKINREQLQRSQIVDGNSDRPYGVFKKVKRSKDWTHSETLRFYKALSTIGTDFTLMCELFPNRTRRELKMKFKKEEKINQILIDKAVMEPCSFDFEELKKEFELVEIERKELEKQRIQEEKLKKTKGIKRSIKFLKFTQQNDKIEKQSTTDTSRIESDQCDDELQQEIRKNSLMDMKLSDVTKERKKQRKQKIPNLMKKSEQKNFDIMSVLTDSDSASDGSEESEVIWKPVQTRYGRKTRKRQIYEPELRMQEEFIVPRKIKRPDIDNEQQQQTQKPGSLMMISSKTPDGQPIVQIFMVTDKKLQNGTEIQGIEENVNTDNLLPIALIKTGQTDDEEEEVVENNYTIPAEPENQNIVQRVDSENVDKVKNIENKIDDTNET